MGEYVQQSISQITIPMSGIWLDPHPVEITVINNNRIVTLNFSQTIFDQAPQAEPALIRGILPGNLWPASDQLFTAKGMDGVPIVVAISISSEGNIVMSSLAMGDVNGVFTGGPTFLPGGFKSQCVTYEIREVPV